MHINFESMRYLLFVVNYRGLNIRTEKNLYLFGQSSEVGH